MGDCTVNDLRLDKLAIRDARERDSSNIEHERKNCSEAKAEEQNAEQVKPYAIDSTEISREPFDKKESIESPHAHIEDNVKIGVNVNYGLANEELQAKSDFQDESSDGSSSDAALQSNSRALQAEQSCGPESIEIDEQEDYSNIESVIFLSVGNICRAPMAAAILIHLVSKRNLGDYWAVDSAALAELHIDELIDARASKCLTGYSIFNFHSCRLVTQRDFEGFKYFYCMDKLDLAQVDKWLPPGFDKSRIKLLGDLYPLGPVELEDPFDLQLDDLQFQSLFRKIFACVSMILDEHPLPESLQQNGVDQQYGSWSPEYIPEPLALSDSESEDEEMFIENDAMYMDEMLSESTDDEAITNSSESDESSYEDSGDDDDCVIIGEADPVHHLVIPRVSPTITDSEGER